MCREFTGAASPAEWLSSEVVVVVVARRILAVTASVRAEDRF